VASDKFPLDWLSCFPLRPLSNRGPRDADEETNGAYNTTPHTQPGEPAKPPVSRPQAPQIADGQSFRSNLVRNVWGSSVDHGPTPRLFDEVRQRKDDADGDHRTEAPDTEGGQHPTR